MLPWEKYSKPVAPVSEADGPWSKYGGAKPVIQPKPEPPQQNETDGYDWNPISSQNLNEMAKGIRPVLEGAAALPSMLGDALTKPLASGIDKIFGDRASENIGLTKEPTNAGEGLSNLVRLPKPENDFDNQASAIIKGASGAMSGMGAGKALSAAANPIIANIGKALFGGQPATQVAAGAAGSDASELVKQGGGGEGAQLISSIAASMIPFAPGAAGGAVKNLVRGGEKGARTMQKNIAAFEGAGDSPSLGQATERPAIQKLESVLTGAPGSGGVMANKARLQQENIGNRVDELAGKLSPKNPDEMQVGRAIKSGIEDDFVPQVKGTQADLFNKLDQFIPTGTAADISNTTSTLSRIAAPIPGAENLSESALLSNPTIKAVFDSVKSDAAKNGGTLPYEALKELRTRVGYKLSDFSLTSDVPRGQLKQLYGALSSDMESAAKAAGPEAYKAFQRANNYTRAMNSRLDTLQSVVDRAGGPEKVFSAATAGTKEGATTIRAVMQSLPEDGQKMLGSSIIRRLGKAEAGQQNDLGDNFSTNTFLKNWNKMAPAAKNTVFKRFGSDFAKDMDQIARVASNLKEGSKIYANPSGTAQAIGNKSTAFAAVASVLGGHPGAAAIIGGTVATANIAARAMTNPKIVKWLANTTKRPSGALPALVNQFAIQATKSKDPEVQEFTEYLQDQLANSSQNDTQTNK